MSPMHYAISGAVIVIASWMLWVFYVCVMRLKMLRDSNTLTTGQKIFGYPTLAIGLVLDLFVNVVVCTFLFLEIPREWTVSSRLWRHSNDEDKGWRMKLALLLRTQLLDSADPSGVHSG